MLLDDDFNYSNQIDIMQIRRRLTEHVNLLYKNSRWDNYRDGMAKLRKIDRKVFDDAKCFYVYDPTEDILPIIGEDYFNELYGYTPKDYMFTQRFIYPTWVDNLVSGFICYDNMSERPYILSETRGFDKTNMLYGLQTYRSVLKQRFVIIVEGLMDYHRLQFLGYPVICMMGTAVQKFLKELLESLDFVIYMVDGDDAGFTTVIRGLKIHKHTIYIRLPDKEDPDSYLRDTESRDGTKNRLKFSSTIEDAKLYYKIRKEYDLRESI